MHFDNLGYLNGAQVSSAVLWLYEFHSYSCTSEPTDIYSVTQAWSGPAVTTYPGPALGALAGTANSADGYSGCGAGWVPFDVTGTVADWAATNGASNLGLAVVAPDETDSYQWKLFYSWDQSSGGTGTTPYLNITWASAATAPSAPTNATATPANSSANITWNLSTNNGGSPITAYYVNAFDGNTGAYIKQVSVCATCTSATIGGLTNGHSYFFGVYALNSVNFSAPDYTATVTPTVLPAAPQSAVASAGNTLDSMVWSPPVPNGGSAVTNYAVLAYYTNNTYSGHDIVVCATCYSATLTGLTNGVAYNLYVTAANPAGWGALAEFGPTTPNINVAAAPTGQTAYAPGTGAIGVEWTQPASTGNAALASYAVNTYDLANGFMGTTVISCPCGALMFTAVTALVTGHTYFFALYAYNSYGYGPVAATATSGPDPAAPGPPTNAIAADSTTTLTVSWVPPAAGGTSTIDDYLIGAVDQATGAIASVTQSCPCTNPVTATVTGLTNGHSYQAAVYAHNATGYGPPVASNVVTTGVAGPQSGTSAAAGPGDSSAFIQWTAPAGGSSPTDYLIYAFNVANSAAPVFVAAQSVASPVALVSGLTNGTAYLFYIFSHNATGYSPPAVTQAVTPQAVLGNLLNPTNVQANPADRTVVAHWNAPPVVSLLAALSLITYTVNVYKSPPGGGNSGGSLTTTQPAANGACSTGTTTDPPAVSEPSPCAVDPNLANGVSYYFIVIATVLHLVPVGTSAPSNAAIPAGRPFPPTITNITNGSTAGGAATVTWTPPPTQPNGTPGNNGSPITGYMIGAAPVAGGTPITNPVGNLTSASISGLTNGSAYNITVTATNALGSSDPSSPVAFTPAGTPFAPVADYAIAGDASATVGFSPPPPQSNGVPGNNGSPIQQYVVTASQGNVSVTVPAQSPEPGFYSAVVSPLSVGTYFFTVTAVNAIGVGAPSGPTPQITITGTPTLPTTVTATASNQSVCVSWSAPSNDNGASITGYTVQLTGGKSPMQSFVLAGTTSTCVTQLTNGVLYTASVEAESTGGPSGFSSSSNGVTPAGPSSPPQITSALGADGEVTMSWNPPSNLNGANPLSYVVNVYSVIGPFLGSVNVDLATSTTLGASFGQSYLTTATATISR